ncbi:MAG: site-2 protease family protein, partial [Candidatus Thorarchaeota archaeon]
MEQLNSFLEFIFNPWFILSLIFWIIVIVFVFLLRKKKDAYNFFFPLLALFKTKRLNNFIIRISKKKPRFWRTFWNIGIFVSFGVTIYGLFFFFINLLNLIFKPSIEQAVVPLIPGVTIDLPVLFYLILPLLFIMTTHEFAHGISASIDGVEIKSTGVLGVGLFYLIGFGAFVEVDERKLRSKKFHRNTRLRIAAAGTFVNGLTAVIAFILLLSFPTLISPFYVQTPQVINVLSAKEGGFNEGNLEIGDTILSIKKQGEPDDLYVNLDYSKQIDLTAILNNETRIGCTIGDNLTFKIYNINTDLTYERDVVLGPRYYLGLEYQELNDTASVIKYNYTSNMATNIIITHINGTAINRTAGYNIGSILTNFTVKMLNLTSSIGETYIIDVQITGVYVGVQTIPFWMHKNDFAKFFTSNWPDFWFKETLWLFIISFSIAIFNMLPLPIFDGDRLIKELINWGF